MKLELFHDIISNVLYSLVGSLVSANRKGLFWYRVLSILTISANLSKHFQLSFSAFFKLFLAATDTVTILTRLLELRTEIKTENLRKCKKCKQEIHSSDYKIFRMKQIRSYLIPSVWVITFVVCLTEKLSQSPRSSDILKRPQKTEAIFHAKWTMSGTYGKH